MMPSPTVEWPAGSITMIEALGTSIPTSMTVVDTIFKALAPAIPDRVIAGHHADLVAPSFHGFNPGTSELFIGNFGPLGGDDRLAALMI